MCGLRKYGVSKEHRPNPIVEMGLFLDRNGIPVSMCLHPGNTGEQLTAVPLEKEILKMTQGAKFIYCADAWLGSYNIRKFNSMGGRVFIVTQSIRRLSDVIKTSVFNDYDYRLLSNDKPVSVVELKSMDKADEKNIPLYRLLERQLNQQGTHITTENLITTLKNILQYWHSEPSPTISQLHLGLPQQTQK